MYCVCSGQLWKQRILPCDPWAERVPASPLFSHRLEAGEKDVVVSDITMKKFVRNAWRGLTLEPDEIYVYKRRCGLRKYYAGAILMAEGDSHVSHMMGLVMGDVDSTCPSHTPQFYTCSNPLLPCGKPKP